MSACIKYLQISDCALSIEYGSLTSADILIGDNGKHGTYGDPGRKALVQGGQGGFGIVKGGDGGNSFLYGGGGDGVLWGGRGGKGWVANGTDGKSIINKWKDSLSGKGK